MTNFPVLHTNYVQDTSLATIDYNCIAWAAGEADRWWWPTPGLYYWPLGAPMEETLEAFIAAFTLLGFSEADNGDLEPNLEKVALYATGGGTPTHMARQLPNGRWTSKLGSGVDIEHATVRQLEGPLYGSVARYLKRQR